MHPFIAKKTFHLTQQVIHVCDSLLKDSTLDADPNGGQLDAFRHAYWMASLVQRIKPNKAYALAIAHEDGNKLDFEKNKMEEGVRPDSMGTVMDIVNDQIGIEIGVQNRLKKIPGAEIEMIRLVIEMIEKGELRVLLKNKTGEYLDCEIHPISLETWKGKWGIPKCLVRSDRGKIEG